MIVIMTIVFSVSTLILIIINEWLKDKIDELEYMNQQLVGKLFNDKGQDNKDKREKHTE